MSQKQLTVDQINQYNQDGFLILKDFLGHEEVTKLHQIAIDDKAMSKNAINVNDSAGKRSKLSLWYKPGDDVYGLLTRSESLVNAVNQLLDGDAPVCHFHSKLMQKEPKVGGAVPIGALCLMRKQLFESTTLSSKRKVDKWKL